MAIYIILTANFYTTLITAIAGAAQGATTTLVAAGEIPMLMILLLHILLYGPLLYDWWFKRTG